MSELKNYREVGLFDLLSAPLSPIGAFDAEQFKTDAQVLLNRGSKFVAVDLTGLDFLYSDAYNAFMQFYQAFSHLGGALGILTDNQTIIDGLHRAGLDRSVLVFREEAALMGFSIKEESGEKKAEELPAHSAAASRRRATGRFTKSFNAICENSGNCEIGEGMKAPFQEDSSSARVWPWVLLVCVLAGAAVAFFVLR